MKFLEYLFRFYFFDLHRIYLRFLYRFAITIDHKFGLNVMIRSLFKPLFGLPGISARITGFVFRIMVILIGSFVVFSSVGLGLLLYPFVVLGIKYIVVRSLILPILILLFLIFIRLYEYIKHPVMKLADVKQRKDFYFASSLNERQILEAVDRSNIKALVDLLRKDKDILEFLYRCELNVEKTLEFVLSNKTFSKKDFYEKVIEVNKIAKFRYLTPSLLFTSLLFVLKDYEGFLSRSKLTKKSILGCLRYSGYIRYRSPYMWEDDFRLNPAGGIDKGWAVGYSGTLNKYSTDYTKLALKGLMPKLIGREQVKTEVIDILSKPSRSNVMLIGDPGCGKTTFIKALANEIATGTSIPALRFKRIVALDIGALTSGHQGEINDRLTKIIKEVRDAGNIIIFIDEIHNLSSTLNVDPNAVAVFSTLEPHLSSGKFQFIGATSRQNYSRYILPNESFSKAFDLVKMKEATESETTLIMEAVAKDIELSSDITITYPAIKSCINFSKKLIHASVFPDKAVELLNQAVAKAKNSHQSILSSSLIAGIVAKITNVPVSKLQEDEKAKLLNLEETLRQRIIGQVHAIRAITRAIKRSRAGVRDEDKPIASFLFVGPTGVGKTETAKALAESYYGSERAMVRLDMSEYQEISSIKRLIGSDSGEIGVLTSHIRANPYSLILVDEVEKAHSNIHNLFLQVLDDGRLTSAQGVLVDFSNTFIIMTTNVGSRDIVRAAKSEDFSVVRTKALKALKEHFTPEFLNRFTDLVPFDALTKDQLLKITKLKLNKLQLKLKQRQIKISFSPSVVRKIAELGYSKEWGARLLNRVIGDKVETLIADKLIKGELKAGDEFVLESI